MVRDRSIDHKGDRNADERVVVELDCLADRFLLTLLSIYVIIHFFVTMEY